MEVYFDGAYCNEGNGVKVLLRSPEGNFIPLSYKLEFDTTNNIAEYEALALGLQDARDLKK